MTDTSEEFGPWIEYQGEGFLRGVSLGMIVQIEGTKGGILWRSPPRVVSAPEMYQKIVLADDERLLRHRIRKPRGLTILEGCLETLPEQERTSTWASKWAARKQTRQSSLPPWTF